MLTFQSHQCSLLTFICSFKSSFTISLLLIAFFTLALWLTHFFSSSLSIAFHLTCFSPELALRWYSFMACSLFVTDSFYHSSRRLPFSIVNYGVTPILRYKYMNKERCKRMNSTKELPKSGTGVIGEVTFIHELRILDGRIIWTFLETTPPCNIVAI